MTRALRVPADDIRLRWAHDVCFPADDEPDWSAAVWWLLVAGQDCLGFAGIQPSARWRDTGYLVRAGVLPEFRGRGLQCHLIDLRLRYARRERGWRWAITATAAGNHASANSLIARGFKLYEPSRPWLANGALYWRKHLCDR